KVGVVGIVVEEHQFAGAAFHDNIDGLSPVAMAPAALFRVIFLGQILGVVDEDVSAFSQLADAAVEDRVAGLVVGGVHQGARSGLQAEAEAALGMIQPHGLNGAVVERNFGFAERAELSAGGHLAHVHGKIGIGHLLLEGALQTAVAAGCVKEEPIVRVVVQRPEKGDALNVVPVKVGDKNMRLDGAGAEFAQQVLAEISKAGAAVEDVEMPVNPHLNAGGVAPVAHVFRLRSRSRAPHSPELNVHGCLFTPTRPNPARFSGTRAARQWLISGSYLTISPTKGQLPEGSGP